MINRWLTTVGSCPVWVRQLGQLSLSSSRVGKRVVSNPWITGMETIETTDSGMAVWLQDKVCVCASFLLSLSVMRAPLRWHMWQFLCYINECYCCLFISCQHNSASVATGAKQSEWSAASSVLWFETTSLQSHSQNSVCCEVRHQRTAEPVSLMCYCKLRVWAVLRYQISTFVMHIVTL